MPNNLVFNNVAQSLLTQIHGVTSAGTVTAILTDDAGRLDIRGSVTSTINGSVTATVTGEVTATVNGSVTATVNGSVTATVTGEVTATVSGSVTATVTGEVSATVNGSVTATVTGEVSATVTGEVTATVNGSVTATVTGEVTATVTGEVTATVSGSVTATVTGEVTATVTGEVTATVVGSVTATVAGEVSVTIAAHGFTSSFATLTGISADLTDTSFSFDTSTIKDYTFYVNNTGSATVLARIQISPTTTESFFTNDTTAQITLTPGQINTLVPGIFLNYTRIQVYGSPSATFTVLAYFNGQF